MQDAGPLLPLAVHPPGLPGHPLHLQTPPGPALTAGGGAEGGAGPPPAQGNVSKHLYRLVVMTITIFRV